jgi:hypothetical protein
MKRSLLLLSVVIAVIGIVWLLPCTTFSIDESWWIVCRFSDDYDPKSAEFLADAYGGTIIDLEADHDFNAFGQSFVFVGGSTAFGAEAPWAEEFLAITKPSTQPSLKWVVPTDFASAYLETPKGTFYASDGNYGMITKAYDYGLRRWIVIVIGWNAECTAAGARIVVMQPDLVETHSWIVYEYTGDSVSLGSWVLSNFSSYVIVETD